MNDTFVYSFTLWMLGHLTDILTTLYNLSIGMVEMNVNPYRPIVYIIVPLGFYYICSEVHGESGWLSKLPYILGLSSWVPVIWNLYQLIE